MVDMKGLPAETRAPRLWGRSRIGPSTPKLR